jgi:hypothetical protein
MTTIGRQARLERLPQHEARLRERPFGRVDEQHHAVHHLERPLDLAAEVGVARRVDDVDARAAIDDGRVLGHDRDALFALQIDRVHDPLGHVFVVAEDPALPEQGVDQRGLAVVDVGDDGEVTDVVSGFLWHRLRMVACAILMTAKRPEDDDPARRGNLRRPRRRTPDRAFASARIALHDAPDDPCHAFPGRAWRSASSTPADAVLEFGRAIALDPDDPEIRAARAQALFATCRFLEAQADAEAALTEKAHADALWVLGLISTEGRFEDADDKFLAARVWIRSDSDADSALARDAMEGVVDRAGAMLPKNSRTASTSSGRDRDLPSRLILTDEAPPLDPECSACSSAPQGQSGPSPAGRRGPPASFCSSAPGAFRAGRGRAQPEMRERSTTSWRIPRLAEETWPSSTWTEWLTGLDPNRSVVEMLALPDGHARLECVDHETAGVHRRGTMGRRDRDDDRASPMSTRPTR